MAYFNILQKKWHSITYLKGFKNAYLSPKLQRALRGARALEPVYDSLGATPLEPEAAAVEPEAAPDEF